MAAEDKGTEESSRALVRKRQEPEGSEKARKQICREVTRRTNTGDRNRTQ